MDRAEAIEQLGSEGLCVTEWRDEPGARYPSHAHPQREVRIVLEGSMTVEVDGAPRVLGPGDRLDLEPGEEHTAEVGPDGVHYLAGSSR